MIMLRREIKTAGEIALLPADRIISDPLRPRKYYNDDALTRLAGSIAENGLIDPLKVRYKNSRFVIVSGERRFRACIEAGLDEIPCLVLSSTEEENALFSITENLHCLQLNCYEEAEAIDRLLTDYGYTPQQLSEKLCIDRELINSRLRLNKIPADIRKKMIEYGLNDRYAAVILKCDCDEMQRELLEGIIKNRLSLYEARVLLTEIKRKQFRGKIKAIYNDPVIFINTIEKAVETMKKNGLNGFADKNETDDYIEYTVRINKSGYQSESSCII